MRGALNTYLPYLVEALLLVALGYAVYIWNGGNEPPSVRVPGQVDMPEHAVYPSAKDIIAVPLFGEQAKAPIAPPRQIPVPVPVKPLSIRVLGTIAAGKDSWVVIGDMQGKHQRSIHVGEFIEPGVKLAQVDDDAIVVERGGRNQLIAMEQWQKLHVTITEAEKPAVAKAGLSAGMKNGKAKSAKQSVNVAEKPHVRSVAPKLSALMTDAVIVPHRVKGKMDGFVINNIIFGSAFQKGGLFNGDVMIKLNGKPLTEENQKNDLLRSLRQKNTKLDVLRAGTVHHIDWK